MPSLVPRHGATLSSSNATQTGCFSYERCRFDYAPCNETQQHFDLRYSEASAAWVLITSIIVFFMKAGFMLVEVAFCRDVKDRRRAIVIKYQDAFASAIGFFIIGFWIINYSSSQDIPYQFFDVNDPLLWFFRFNYASNAATIVGGCLLRSEYKMRIPAAFISAFVISGFIHPVIARIIWSDSCNSHFTFSPYRFCNYEDEVQSASTCPYNCSSTENMGWFDKLYVLDFSGGGAVHLLAGVAALTVALLAKIQKKSDHKEPKCWFFKWRDGVDNGRPTTPIKGAESPERNDRGYWLWMYPESGGDESLVAEAGLGVMILWFCWFAFNCGSTESVELARYAYKEGKYPYYGIAAHIAINMIMAVAAGGTVAVAIAVGVQVHYNSESVCSNEIANGVLSSLVAITAGCPFVDYWAACIIGSIAVLLYHGGCYIEYKFDIEDGARIFPVHGICGFWSVLAVGFFILPQQAQCNLHATFEGLCYCELRLPPLVWYEHLVAQLLGAVTMLVISAVGCILLYGVLFCWPIRCFCSTKCTKIYCCRYCNTRTHGEDYGTCDRFKGGLLLTFPNKPTRRLSTRTQPPTLSESSSIQDTGTPTREINRDASSQGTNYGSSGSHHTATNGPRHRAAERTVRADVEPPPPTDNPSSHGTSGSYHTAPSSSRRRPAHGVAVTLNERQPLLVDQHAL